MTVKKILTYFVIIGIAMMNALNYELFIFPNQFAPSGLNGLCTMLQHLTGFGMGYMSLILNIPLAIAVYFLVSHTLAIRAMSYVVVFSVSLLVLDHVDLSAIAYTSAISAIMGPLVGGIISGAGCAVLLRASAYSGGTDFVASLIHKFRPDFNFFWTGFSLNVVVAVISFFVYGYKLEPVLLCILYCFTFSSVLEKMNRSGRSAMRFEIITDEPEVLSRAIIDKLHHSATLIPGKGAFRGHPTNIIVCVINKAQSAVLAGIVREHPGSFAVISQVSEVVGNFKHLDNHGNLTPEFLDPGDGTGIE